MHRFKKSGTTQTILISFSLAFIFLLIFYAKPFLSPNDYVFSNKISGDGIKNYYAYAYHIKHDTSYVHFQGMNYPYGELHLYTDGNHAVANLVKLIAGNDTDNAIGILNFCLLFSFILGAIFMGLILYENKLPVLFASIGGLAIMSLSPQIHRIAGHIGLVYFFSFPAIWYFVIKCIRKPQVLYTVIILAINLFLIFTHPYLAVINFIFITLFFLFSLFKKEFNLNRWRLFLHYFFQVVFVLIVWLAYTKINDHHINRPDNVFQLNWVTSLPNIFLPNVGPVRVFFNQSNLNLNYIWEGWAYIGLLSNIFIFIMLYRMIKNLIVQNNFRPFPKSINNELKIAFWCSFIMLFYAFGVPFKQGGYFILDIFPFLKQIRALGRFAWAFFYVINVLTLVFIYKYIQEKFKEKNKLVKYVLMSLMLSLLIWEGVMQHKVYGKRIIKTPNYFSRKSASNVKQTIDKAIHSIDDLHEYQAIIPVPFYHIGSANLTMKPRNHSFLYSLLLSYNTGLPLVGSKMARTSIDESNSIMQIFSPEFIDKSYFDAINSEKKFLLLSTNRRLRNAEKHFIKKAKSIYTSKKLNLYEIKSEAFTHYNYDQLLEKLAKSKHQDQNGFLTNKPGHDIIFKGYGNEKLFNELTKEKAAARVKTEKTLLLELDADKLKPNANYEFSFWYAHDAPGAIKNVCNLILINRNGEKVKRSFKLIYYIDVISEKWVLIKRKFKIFEDTEKIVLFLQSKSREKQTIYYDDLLIRHKEANVFKWLNDSVLFYNNLRVDLKKR